MIIDTAEGPAVLLKDLARLDLREGDKLIVFTERPLEKKIIDALVDQMSKLVGCQVIVMESGLRLAVLGRTP